MILMIILGIESKDGFSAHDPTSAASSYQQEEDLGAHDPAEENDERSGGHAEDHH